MNEYQNEKFQDALNDHVLDGVSECCGMPASSDLQICSECGEHCTVVSEEEYTNPPIAQDSEKDTVNRLCKQLKEYILKEASLEKELNWYRNYSAYINKIHYTVCGEASDYADKCDGNE